MLRFMLEPPQNTSYMWAGYLVGLGILLGYAVWLWVRVGKAVGRR